MNRKIEETKVKMMIFRVKRMSKDGFSRLSVQARINFRKTVFKPLGKIVIDTKKVYDERTLAKFLIFNFNAGLYTGHFWNPQTSKLGKQAFKVLIRGNLESKWGYEFVSTRGIANLMSPLSNYLCNDSIRNLLTPIL